MFFQLQHVERLLQRQGRVLLYMKQINSFTTKCMILNILIFHFLHNFPHMWNNNVKNSSSRFVVNAKWDYAYKYHVVLLRKRQPVLLLLLQHYEVWLKVIYPWYKYFMIVDWFHNESVFIWFQKFKKKY